MNKVEVEKASLDALIRQVDDLNKSLRINKIEQMCTEYLDSNEAAQYMKLSKRSLQLLRDNGEIQYYQRNMTIWYKRKDLDDWIQKHKVSVNK